MVEGALLFTDVVNIALLSQLIFKVALYVGLKSPVLLAKFYELWVFHILDFTDRVDERKRCVCYTIYYVIHILVSHRSKK